MAILHCDSAGSNTAPYETWAKAATAFNTAISAAADGDTVYLDDGFDDRANITVNTVYGNPTGRAKLKIISVDKATETDGTTCSYSTGAIIGTSTAGVRTEFASGSELYFYGVHWYTQQFINSTQNLYIYWEDGLFDFDDAWRLTDGARIELVNCTWRPIVANVEFLYTFGGGDVFIRGLTFSAATANSNRIHRNFSGEMGRIQYLDCDFSAMTSGVNLLTTNPGNDGEGSTIRFAGCKFPASWGGMSTVSTNSHERLEVYASSTSLGTVHVESDTGTAVNEATTVHTATYDGSTKYSIKITPTAKATFHNPFYIQLAEFWSAANPTLTINVTYDGTTLQNDEVWIQIDYPDATNPGYRKFDDSTRAASLQATPANIGTSGSGWTSAKTNQHTIAKTIAGGGAGVHRVTLYYAPAATTPVLYVDPHIDIS